MSEGLATDLKQDGIRVELDARDGLKPGAKYYEWEGRGVPVRLEVGPRDVAEGQAMLARRTGGKSPIKLAGMVESLGAVFLEIQDALYAAASNRMEENSVRSVSKQQLIDLMNGPGGFAYGGFCGGERCEIDIKDSTKATVRVLPDEEFSSDPPPTTCVWCGKDAVSEAVWAKAY